MAISDALHEARTAIEGYIQAESSFMYEGLEPDVEWLLQRMKELQDYLDNPASDARPPNFLLRFPDAT